MRNYNANVSTVFAYSSSTAQETKRIIRNSFVLSFIFLNRHAFIFMIIADNMSRLARPFLNCKVSLQMLVIWICIRINSVGQVVSPNPFCLLVRYQSQFWKQSVLLVQWIMQSVFLVNSLMFQKCTSTKIINVFAKMIFFPLFDTTLCLHKVLLSSIRAKESKFMKLEGEVWAGMQSVEIKLPVWIHTWKCHGRSQIIF